MQTKWLIITSQDEEIDQRVKLLILWKEIFSKILSIVDKIFTFGEHDINFLLKQYPKFKSKIVNTSKI